MGEALKIGQKLIILHVSEVVMVKCKLSNLEDNLAMSYAYTTMHTLCLRLLGFCQKAPQTRWLRWLKQQAFISAVLEAGIPKVRVPAWLDSCEGPISDLLMAAF